MRYGWHLGANGWSNLARLLDGSEWKRQILEIDYVSRVPKESGVYIICASPEMIPINGKVMKQIYSPVYVGQSSNVHLRFRDHVRGYGEVRDAKVLFRRLDFWYTVAAQADLNDLEQALIDAFGPPCNGRNVQASIGEPIPLS